MSCICVVLFESFLLGMGEPEFTFGRHLLRIAGLIQMIMPWMSFVWKIPLLLGILVGWGVARLRGDLPREGSFLGESAPRLAGACFLFALVHEPPWPWEVVRRVVPPVVRKNITA
jgi:hypothetical protein